MITEYHLYADERYQNNRRHLMIGGLICTEKGSERLRERLRLVRARHNLINEMKWGRVSKSYIDAYKAWIDVFLEDRYARFTVLKINLSEHEWGRFRPRQDRKPTRNSKLASAFYQFLLISCGKLRDTKRWWVYPDAGFFSTDRVLDQVEFLFNRTYKKAFGPKTSRIIRLMRSRDSKKDDLIQLTDVLLALVSCHTTRKFPSSPARRELVNYWIEQINMTPKTGKGFEKITLRDWVPPEQFNFQ